MKKKLSVNLGSILLSLSELMDIANPELSQHQLRTAFIALKIAREAKLEPGIIEDIFAASLLHDIGAISIEEKEPISKFQLSDYSQHCIRGKILLQEIPSFEGIAEIVKNHQKSWKSWGKDIDNHLVLSSQMICLADYVERLIDRSKYIGYQQEHILEEIEQLNGSVVNEEIFGHFISVAKREAFWLDLTSPKLYSILLHNGPYKNREVGLEELSLIAELFRHIIDFKSSFTATHTAGVAACAEIMASLFGLAELEVVMMKIAGNFHDLGKLIIPNNILEKPGKLSKDEYNVIKSHPYYTHQVLSSIGGMDRIVDWASFHHEKLDGSGYPFSLDANEIDTGARIMAVSDIFVALIEERPYKKGMERDEMYRILKKQGENNFIDIKMVELLFDNYDAVNTYVKSEQAKAEKFYRERFINLIDDYK